MPSSPSRADDSRVDKVWEEEEPTTDLWRALANFYLKMGKEHDFEYKSFENLLPGEQTELYQSLTGLKSARTSVLKLIGEAGSTAQKKTKESDLQKKVLNLQAKTNAWSMLCLEVELASSARREKACEWERRHDQIGAGSHGVIDSTQQRKV